MFWRIYIVISLACLNALIRGECPVIITRQEWGSTYSLPSELLTPPVQKVIFLHTSTFECDTRNQCEKFMRNTQIYHVEEMDFDDIGFNFVIGGDGNIYEGRGWETVGAHTFGHNRDSIGIAFIGNYMKKVPKEEMLKAAEKLIECGTDKGYISPNYGLYGQRDGVCSLGPGKKFYETLENTWPHWHQLGELLQKCSGLDFI